MPMRTLTMTVSVNSSSQPTLVDMTGLGAVGIFDGRGSDEEDDAPRLFTEAPEFDGSQHIEDQR